MGILEVMGRAAKSGRPFKTDISGSETYFFKDLMISVFFGPNREASDLFIQIGQGLPYQLAPAVFGSCDFHDRESVFQTAVRLGIAKDNQYMED